MVETADAIVEGEVISKKAFEHNGRIYSSNEIKIISVLKSSENLSSTLSIITLGGRIADKSESYNHVAHLSVNDEGVFLLRKSNISKGGFQLIGETNGYYRESNKYKSRYFSYAGVFEDLNELKGEIFERTRQLERKIIQRGCFNLSIDFDAANANSSDIRFRVLCSSDIPSTYLNSMHLPLIYDPSEYTEDPFESDNISIGLALEFEGDYTLNKERINENIVGFAVSNNSMSDPIFIGNEFIPILEGTINISSLDLDVLPHIDILKSGLLENTSYVTPDFTGSPQLWNCLDFDDNIFNEFMPRIDSIAPLNVSAGVGDMSENGIPGVITIYGSGFGTPAPGAFSAGTVGFPDAESIIPTSQLVTQSLTFPAELDYISWSDTQIRVRVPSRNNNIDSDADQGVATSGRITVNVNGNSTISSQELYVHFGMFNDYQLDSNNVIGAKKRRMSARWRNVFPEREGYIISIDTSVLNNIPNAYSQIEEALDEWRCNQDHPIWVELDTTMSNINTGIISMSNVVPNSLAALTGIVDDHHTCPGISVSNLFDIGLNPQFTFVDFPITSPDSFFLKKIMVHEFGHAFLARHTVNRSIMYPDQFFENIFSLTSDDHLCGEHTFIIGNSGPPCEPISNSVLNLNIGSFDCQTNSVFKNVRQQFEFEIFPNPAQDLLNINIDNIELQGRIQSIRILDIGGKVVYEEQADYEDINLRKLPSGLYFVQLMQNGQILSTEKLVHYE